jgi:enamine deaminase RidA (YjgF/YER057c/UK114 family)
MNRKNITSGSPFETAIGFSRAVRIGNTIAVSGTAAIASDGTAAYPDDVYRQTLTCIDIMRQAIEEAGGRLEDVVRTRIMLKNIAFWREAARAHGEFFAEIKPACTFVEVKGFVDPQWLVETEADCVIAGE